VVIHSSNGDPWGYFESGGIDDYTSDKYNESGRVDVDNWSFPNQYEGPTGPGGKPPVWIGWFVKNDNNYNDAFNNIVHDLAANNTTENYRLHFSSTQGFYPKVFCGPTITIDWSDDKLAYCEMWFSPNAPSFWHGPSGLADFSGFIITFTPTHLDIAKDLLNKVYLPVILH
jgi:hypothetical protein